ncbi:MAG: right-handed parallel beta-helix repeat-containing protein [Clostridia bacterium]|nr:right-handed parallel beta-helix repeat-containing protein [Clostridia bacterium]
MYQLRNSATIYVSQTHGDDKLYSGLAPVADDYGNGPFKTLEYALSVLRTIRKAGVERPMTVSLTEDYFLTAPLSLSDGIRRVTLESFGSRKRIIGGVRIEGWSHDRFNGFPCFSAKLSPKDDGTPWNFTDLYVNGKRASATRYPKTGTLKLLDSEDQQKRGRQVRCSHVAGSSKWLIANPEDLASVEQIEDAMIHYYHYWIDEHSPIESYDRSSGKLEMLYSSRFTVSTLCEANSHGTTYFLTNVPNTFDTPGEWYLDKKRGTVYYIPEDEDMAPETLEVFVPTVSHLMEIEDSDLRLRNLELTCTLGDYASTKTFDPEQQCFVDGDIPYGGDIQSVCWAPGAIVFRNALRCGMFGCHLHGVGVHGIDIREGCRYIRIENNCIEDICAGGIKVFGGEPGSEPSKAVSDCQIRNNHISHCGKRYAAGCGILVCHASNNEISGNEIHDLEYSGISVGWVWGYGESPTYGNVIRGNHIYNVGKGNLSDMGGIYLLGKQPGTVVSENRIHDVTCFHDGYGAWGIYLDEGSSYITVEHNAVYRTGQESFHLHYGSHNTVRNNIFFGLGSSCVRTSKEELHDEIVFEQNILITDGAPIYGGGRANHTLGGRRNLLWDISKAAPTPGESREGKPYSLEVWQNVFGLEKGSIAEDPKISGLLKFDFTLSEDSPALSLGFTPLADHVAKNK